MDNPAPTIPWWKKGMNLTQLVIYLAIALVFVGLGAGISYIIGRNPAPKAITVPAMAAAPEVELTLDVTNPIDAATVQEKLIKVAGRTLPNTSLVVFGVTTSKVGFSDENGNFEVEIELVEGTNTLSVTAVSGDGQEKTLIREVALGEVSKFN